MAKIMKHVSREMAMKIAFARLLGGGADYDDAVSISYSEDDPNTMSAIMDKRGEGDIEFAKALANGIEEHRSELDDIINDYLKEWSTDTISKIELTILRIAVYELLYTKDVPQGAVIDEAVELTKLYSDEKKYSYINGVLSSIVKDINNN